MANMLNIDQTAVEAVTPQATPNFVEYLVRKYANIPGYAVHSSEVELTEENMSNQYLNSVGETLKYSNKTCTPVKYVKIADNKRVVLDDNFLEVSCDATETSKIHELNSGYVFCIPNNHILLITPDEAASKYISMNPILLDSATRTSTILILHSKPLEEDMKFKLKMQLFLVNNNYTFQEVAPKQNGGALKNFKGVGQLTMSKGEDGPFVINCSQDSKFKLSKSTALIIVYRKRNHRSKLLPLFGALFDKTGNLTLSSHNDKNLELAGFSFTVVTKNITNFKFVQVETIPPFYNSNGGYHGWFHIYDSNYEEAVKLYKGSQKIMKWTLNISNLLKGLKLYSPENVQKVLDITNPKKIKMFQKDVLKNVSFPSIDAVIDQINAYALESDEILVTFTKRIADNNNEISKLLEERQPLNVDFDDILKANEKRKLEDNALLEPNGKRKMDEADDDDENKRSKFE
ncbi:hypothetical protein PvNV_055 [Penaeus vannamei nudivirus]|nr:hypothetical protein PvSNPV_055 [Penaeus vannamei nucleopolyhedrovirus]